MDRVSSSQVFGVLAFWCNFIPNVGGLGAVLLGGMFVSTLVTLVLVPLLLGLCFRLFPAT